MSVWALHTGPRFRPEELCSVSSCRYAAGDTAVVQQQTVRRFCELHASRVVAYSNALQSNKVGNVFKCRSAFHLTTAINRRSVRGGIALHCQSLRFGYGEGNVRINGLYQFAGGIQQQHGKESDNMCAEYSVAKL